MLSRADLDRARLGVAVAVPLGAAVVARVVCQLRGAALVRVAALRLKGVAVMNQESPVRPGRDPFEAVQGIVFS